MYRWLARQRVPEGSKGRGGREDEHTRAHVRVKQGVSGAMAAGGEAIMARRQGPLGVCARVSRGQPRAERANSCEDGVSGRGACVRGAGQAPCFPRGRARCGLSEVLS